MAENEELKSLLMNVYNSDLYRSEEIWAPQVVPVVKNPPANAGDRCGFDP